MSAPNASSWVEFDIASDGCLDQLVRVAAALRRAKHADDWREDA